MKKNTKFNLKAAEPVDFLRSSFLKEITMNNFKILITTLALFAFIGMDLSAQQVWLEDFDGANVTNPPVFTYQQYCTNRDYFDIVCTDNSGCSNEVNSDFFIGNAMGQYLGVRDIDHNGCVGDVNGESVTFLNIDISSIGGANVPYVCFSVAESQNMGGAAGAEWGNSNMRDDTWDGNSSVQVTASIDGGAATPVSTLEAAVGSDSQPGWDLNGSGQAGFVDPISDVFTEYCFQLPTTGTVLTLDFSFFGLNTGGEDVAIDNISVQSVAPGATPAGSTGSATILSSLTPFVCAPAAAPVASNITHITCANDANGSVTITDSGSSAGATATVFVAGVTDPATGSGQTLTNGMTDFTLGAGVYDVLITDANGCPSDVTTFEIFAAPEFVTTCTVVGEGCVGDNAGTIEFSSTYDVQGPARTLMISLEANGAVVESAAYTAGTTVTYPALEAGTYTVRLVDDLGCEFTEVKVISTGSVIETPQTTGVTICQVNGNDPTVVDDLTATTVSPCTGNSLISWYAEAASTTALATGETFNPVTQGGADATIPGMTVFWAEASCDDCFSIRVPVAFMVTMDPTIDVDAVTNESCAGANDGTVFVDAHDDNGGTMAGLSIGIVDASGAVVQSAPAADGPVQFTLAPGTYMATFVDGTGAQLAIECNSVGMFTILSAEDGMIDSMVSTDASCNGSTDGTITLTASGTPGFVAEYSINGGPWQTSGAFTDLAAGAYNIIARNQNAIDCTIELATITIAEPDALPVGTPNDLIICSGQETAALTAVIQPCSGCSDPCGLCASMAPIASRTFTETFTLDYTGNDGAIGDLEAVQYVVPSVLPCATNVTGISMTVDAITGSTGTFIFGTDQSDAVVIYNSATTLIGQDVMALDPPVTFTDGTMLNNFGPGEVPYQPGDSFFILLGSLDDDAGTATFTVTYTYDEPDISGLPAAIDPVVTWWNSPAFGTDVTSSDTDGVAEVFDPIAAGLVNPNVPGTHTFYAQADCGGCLAERVPVVLTVSDELAAPAIDGPAFVCAGSTETYSIADDGNNYIWTLDGVEVGTGTLVDIAFDGTTISQTVAIASVDGNGCSNTGTIVVTQEIDNALFCNPSKNASVGTDCTFEVTPFSMVKNPSFDESSYAVTLITNTATGDVVWNAATGSGSTILTLDIDPSVEDCTQHYSVTVEHVCSGNRCTGALTLEDKTAPTIACPSSFTDTPIETISGDLSAEDPTFDRIFLLTDDDLTTCVGSGTGLGVSYDAFTFQIDATDTYTFTNTFAGNATAGIYLGSFDPLNPCTNLVAYDDNGNTGTDDALIITELMASGTYVLVTSSFRPEEFGDYDWTITSAGGGVAFNPIEDTFFCTQIDDMFTPNETVLNLDTDVLMPGIPTVSDNCTNFVVTYSDEMIGSSCALSIARTFSVTDACGNISSCEQIINFTNPDLADVIFPGSVDAECDGSGVTQVHPDSLGEEFNYPYIGDPTTGDLNAGLCNINLTWTDQVLDQCGSSYKVLREWTVLDWCAVEAGAEETYVQGAQIIFVTDTKGPEITCSNQVYAADPFECEAVITIPSITYIDQCSGIGATINNNGFPRDIDNGNTSRDGDVDNDRVWFVNGDEAVDLQGFTISVTVDGAPYILYDNNGDTRLNGVTLLTDGNGDRILVDVPAGGSSNKPYEAQMGDQIRLVGSGNHEIVYSVTDLCGNTSTHTSIITIDDQTAPNPICDENTVAVLGGDGTATICWETFDDGSFDNCDDVIVRVKRMNDTLANFSECVLFDCSDLSYTNCEVDGTTQVRMRVYQAGDAGALTFTDNETPGILWNECMVNVTVQDKQAPAIICPPDKFLDCKDDYHVVDNVTNDSIGPEVYKDGILIGYYNGPIIDNCDNHRIDLTESGSIDGCGEGDIYRTYTITDLTTCAEHSCIQRINVSKTPDQVFLDGVVSCGLFENNILSPLVNGHGDRDRINWPSDENINCAVGSGAESTDPSSTGVPTYGGTEEDDCHNLLQGFEDKFHYNDPNNCYVILRTWSVYDWCQYDPNSGSCQGVWSHVQVISVNDNTAPVITCGDDVFAPANSTGCADGEGCTGIVTLPVEASDACGGEVTISHEIDAFWNGSSFTADFSGDGIVTDTFPSGTHRVRYTATDACGNSSSCMYNFTIEDMKAPTPVCVALNSVTMDESGSLQMWASDFESGSSCDNCSLYENLQWRIRKANDPTPLPDVITADDLPTGVTFTCADGEIGGNEVYIYLFDEAGNYDFCLTGINIIPGNEDCLGAPETNLRIAGHIETEDTDMVENVNVDVSGMNTSIFTTGNNGLFDFLNTATPGGNYVITPEKDINYLNGVTTFDLVLISQHILGVQTLDSPYKIIAADANKSNTVTTLDLVKLQRLILNIDTDLAPNTSWRFVDMDHVFTDLANPFTSTFPEVISINNMNADEMAADFVGVKIGDVNGSAASNRVLGTATRNIEGNLTLVADEMSAATGETFTVDFTADNFNNVLGYQFTLDFDATSMDMVEIIPGALKGLTTDNFGLAMLNDGSITTSWFNAKSVSVESDEVLFSVTFNAISDLKLSDVLSISSDVTRAEAYNGDADLLDVNLGINTENGIVTNAVFELLQNSPNPFKGETLISFSLPATTPATLTIMDVSGKLLKTIEGDFVKGYNEVKLDGAQFQGAGVLYYQLDTPTDTATKKMILID